MKEYNIKLFVAIAVSVTIVFNLISGPAVIIGSPTTHGGNVVGDGGLVAAGYLPGVPTNSGMVRINGSSPVAPGAMHLCPLSSGIPPIPHVGGPITGPPISSQTRVHKIFIVLDGASASCIGPVDTVNGNSPNVRINK